MSKLKSKQLIISAIGLAIILAAVLFVTIRLRPAGSMTVLEAQAMGSEPADGQAGAAPVAVETVQYKVFAPTVTYTGSVAALNDEDVYPRVTGTLAALYVYPGDHVRAGQIVARLDSAELISRREEASSAEQAAVQDVGVSAQQRQQAVSQQQAAQDRVAGMRGGLRDAAAQIDAARAMQVESNQDVNAAQAGLSNAEANITSMQADADYWSSELSREATLYKSGAVSTDEYQREVSQAKGAQSKLAQAVSDINEKKAMVGASRAKLLQAQAGVVSAKARNDQAKAAILGAHADLDASSANVILTDRQIRQRLAMADQAGAQFRTANIVQGYTDIRAQQEGTVTERLASPGTLVQPGMVILRIKNVSQVRLQANVSEADLAGIRVGNAVKVVTDAVPPVAFTAHVTSLFPAANGQSRTVMVEARVNNPGGRLLPGQYVTMEIATDTATPRMTVPISAVHTDVSQRPYVWLAVSSLISPPDSGSMPGMGAPTTTTSGPSAAAKHKGLTAHRVFVTLGASAGDRQVVLSGLSAGDNVIFQGGENVSEGDVVATSVWADDGPAELPKVQSMPPTQGNSMQGMPGM